MKNMNNKTKKWLVVAGCLVICAVLVVMIGNQFKTEPYTDQPLPNTSSEANDVTVDTNVAEKEKEVVVTIPDLTKLDSTKPESTDNGAVSTGTEQTIQGDVTKPEYTEEQMKNPDQKPNGDKVTEQDKVQEHEKVEPPKDVPKPDSKPSGGDTQNGKIYVPGFGWIEDNGGGGQGTVGESDGDINKQVGTMD